jgi:hypothetical protein
LEAVTLDLGRTRPVGGEGEGGDSRPLEGMVGILREVLVAVALVVAVVVVVGY